MIERLFWVFFNLLIYLLIVSHLIFAFNVAANKTQLHIYPTYSGQLKKFDRSKKGMRTFSGCASEAFSGCASVAGKEEFAIA